MITRTSILDQILQPGRGEFSKELSDYILSLDFPQAIRDQCDELSSKASDGTLTEDEAADLDQILALSDFLTILQAKAHLSLQRLGINPAA